MKDWQLFILALVGLLGAFSIIAISIYQGMDGKLALLGVTGGFAITAGIAKIKINRLQRALKALTEDKDEGASP